MANAIVLRTKTNVACRYWWWDFQCNKRIGLCKIEIIYIDIFFLFSCLSKYINISRKNYVKSGLSFVIWCMNNCSSGIKLHNSRNSGFLAFYFNATFCTFCGGTAVCDITITGITLTFLSTKFSKKTRRTYVAAVLCQKLNAYIITLRFE